jgi:hypothetical protein
MSTLVNVARTACVAGLILVGGSAFAQTNSASGPANGPTNPVAATGPQSGGADDQSELRAPVLRITSVEVIRSTHGGPLDIIRVRGLTSSKGWEEAELVPLTRGIPSDGVLEMVMIAKAPADAQEAKGFEVVEAIFPLESDHPFKGVNVHSATESITLTQFPGYADGKPAGEDCSKCVGKYFVAKGAALPAGKSAAEVVREEQLPGTVHVIRASDGISKPDSDPNRLTLLLNKEGKITTAVWD